jgi:hypothetical protein
MFSLGSKFYKYYHITQTHIEIIMLYLLQGAVFMTRREETLKKSVDGSGMY